MARIRNDKTIENEIFDLLKFSDEQRAEARGEIKFKDTDVFVANRKSDDITAGLTLH